MAAVNSLRLRRTIGLGACVVALAGSVDWAVRTVEPHRTVLTTGVTDRVPWQLFATNKGDGPLCVGMTGGHRGDYGYECGFGPYNADAQGPENSSEFPGGDSVEFGPAPARAATVTISSASAEPECAAPTHGRTVTASLVHSLPAWAPNGKWFAVTYRESCAVNVTFRDSRGHVVPYQQF